ncbi:MAG: hypothetical protein HYX56_06640 [Chloroflexi bacterium]|nr:hypothetical protein [Chloroflexota bacterium]
MVDHVPLAAERPRPRLPTLTLLVGRITTIKLTYWAVLTAAEIVLGARILLFEDRFPLAVAVAIVTTIAACAWAALSARAIDARSGGIERSLPAVATTFVAASVIATPASLPLLFLEIRQAGEACTRGICHWEAIWYWVAAFVAGTVLIPLVFALRLRTAP